MFKALFLLRRRPGMTIEEFIDYYENTHSKFIRLMPGVRHYVRRYVQPLASGIVEHAEGLGCDVVMEMWCETRADFDAAFAAVESSGMRPAVVADEEKLFDRTRMVGLAIIEEHETPLP